MDELAAVPFRGVPRFEHALQAHYLANASPFALRFGVPFIAFALFLNFGDAWPTWLKVTGVLVAAALGRYAHSRQVEAHRRAFRALPLNKVEWRGTVSPWGVRFYAGDISIEEPWSAVSRLHTSTKVVVVVIRPKEFVYFAKDQFESPEHWHQALEITRRFGPERGS
jgi:hypothetical protein